MNSIQKTQQTRKLYKNKTFSDNKIVSSFARLAKILIAGLLNIS